MKLFTIRRPLARPGAAPPIPKGYSLWLVLFLVLLVGSLLLLGVAAALAFVSYSDTPIPLWLTVFGVLAALGVAAGFGGLFLLVLLAGWRSFRAPNASATPGPDGTTPLE